MEFVSHVRKLRKKEIEIYEKKGYLIHDKAKYIFTDELEINVNERMYQVGIRANINEVYFYFLKKGSNIYFSIIEIYDLLRELTIVKGNRWVLDVLDYYCRSTETITYRYSDEEFKLHRIPKDIPDGEIEIQNSDVKITFEELFILIYLIQDKSNYFESLSKEPKYMNGLVRLLKVLLACDAENMQLEGIGWKYNTSLEKYELKKGGLVGERHKKKYYLTEEEEKSIL